MIDLMQVMTFSEAAEKWGFANGNTLRKAVERKKFREDEIRKSGDVWLTTYDAMLRVFGQPRKIKHSISYEEIERIIFDAMYKGVDPELEIDRLMHSFSEAIEQGESIRVIRKLKEQEHVIQVIQSKSEFEQLQKRLRLYFQSVTSYAHKENE